MHNEDPEEKSTSSLLPVRRMQTMIAFDCDFRPVSAAISRSGNAKSPSQSLDVRIDAAGIDMTRARRERTRAPPPARRARVPCHRSSGSPWRESRANVRREQRLAPSNSASERAQLAQASVRTRSHSNGISVAAGANASSLMDRAKLPVTNDLIHELSGVCVVPRGYFPASSYGAKRIAPVSNALNPLRTPCGGKVRSPHLRSKRGWRLQGHACDSVGNRCLRQSRRWNGGADGRNLSDGTH